MITIPLSTPTNISSHRLSIWKSYRSERSSRLFSLIWSVGIKERAWILERFTSSSPPLSTGNSCHQHSVMKNYWTSTAFNQKVASVSCEYHLGPQTKYMDNTHITVYIQPWKISPWIVPRETITLLFLEMTIVCFLMTTFFYFQQMNIQQMTVLKVSVEVRWAPLR